MMLLYKFMALTRQIKFVETIPTWSIKRLSHYFRVLIFVDLFPNFKFSNQFLHVLSHQVMDPHMLNLFVGISLYLGLRNSSTYFKKTLQTFRKKYITWLSRVSDVGDFEEGSLSNLTKLPDRLKVPQAWKKVYVLQASNLTYL